MADTLSIYKVETVGEVYMMVAGCPSRSVNHAVNAAKMALLMLQAMPTIRASLIAKICPEETADENTSAKIDLFNKIDIKVGLNSGAVTAGVIGETCQRFKLFGDTVNTASRMETNSLPGMITCSESTFRSLVKINVKSYKFKKRDLLQIKGKGDMQTYFLVGSAKDDVVDYDKDLTENFVNKSNIFMVRLQNSSSGTPEHIKLLEAIDLMDESPVGHDGVLSPSNAGKMGNGYASERDAGDGKGSIDENASTMSPSQDMDYIRDFLRNSEPKNMASAFWGKLRNRFAGNHASMLQEFQKNLYRKLVKRSMPQLPQSQTLLLIFGFRFPLYKLTEKEVGFETLYMYNNYTRNMPILRNLFAFYSIIIICMVFYDFFGVENTNIYVLLIRFLPQFLACVGYLLCTRFKYCYQYHQTLLIIVWLVIGMDTVVYETFLTKGPNYGLLLIIIMLQFFFESMCFLFRFLLAILLAVTFFIFTSLFCVSFWDNNVETGEPMNMWENNENFNFNLTRIGLKFCGEEDMDFKTFQEEEFWPPTSGSDTSILYRLEDGAKLKNFMIGSIYDEGYNTILDVQTMTIKDSIINFLMIVFFVLLLTYPTWIADYYTKVCFNRVIMHEERETEMLRASKSTQDHLNRLLPGSIVQILQNNPGQSIAERFESVTILFCDMVGFTKFSSQLDPDELVLFLNHLYSKFDSVLSRFSLYKVEIIGDALFAVAGCPQELYDPIHAARAVCCAHVMLEEVKNVQDYLDISVKVRIGVHTGDVVAGVVGVKDPRYHLFGETVSTAETIESSGAAGRVHVSEATKQSIQKCGRTDIVSAIDFELRDEGKLPSGLDEEKLRKAEGDIAKAREVAGKSYFSSVNQDLKNLPFLKLQLLDGKPPLPSATSDTSGRIRRRTIEFK